MAEPLHKEELSSDDYPELIRRMAKIQREIKHAAFDAKNPHFGSKYASLKSVIDTVRGMAAAQDIAIVQKAAPFQQGFAGIETDLCFGSAVLSFGGIYIPLGTNHNAHGYGSAQTYARRYSLAMAFCIAADDDDDANTAATNPDWWPAEWPKSGAMHDTLASAGLTKEIAEEARKFASYLDVAHTQNLESKKTGDLNLAKASIEDALTLMGELDEAGEQTKLAAWAFLPSAARTWLKKTKKESENG